MVVPALTRAAHRTGGKYLLDPNERRPVDERFVAPFVLDAVPLDDADIRPVGEEVCHARDGHRLGRVAAVASPVAKAPVGHLLSQALDRPLARGVLWRFFLARSPGRGPPDRASCSPRLSCVGLVGTESRFPPRSSFQRSVDYRRAAGVDEPRPNR